MEQDDEPVLVLTHQGRLPSSSTPFIQEICQSVFVVPRMPGQFDHHRLVFFHSEHHGLAHPTIIRHAAHPHKITGRSLSMELLQRIWVAGSVQLQRSTIAQRRPRSRPGLDRARERPTSNATPRFANEIYQYRPFIHRNDIVRPEYFLFHTGISASSAHVDLLRERLYTSGLFTKAGPFPNGHIR